MQEHPHAAGPQHAPVRVSFEEVYRAHLAYVWANLRGLGVVEKDLEDAAQDVFLVYHRRRNSLDHASRLRPWLFGVTRRVAGRYRRTRARRLRLWRGLAAEPAPVVGLEHRAEAREAARLIDAFLQRLDEDKRVVFVLAEIQQRTAREIADIIGVSSNTVSSRLRLGRRAFDRHFARLRARDPNLMGLGSEPSAEVLLSYARGGYRPTPTQRARIVAAWGLGARGVAVTAPVTSGVAAIVFPLTTIVAVLAVAALGVQSLRAPPAPSDVAPGAARSSQLAIGPAAEEPTPADPPGPAAIGVAPVVHPPPEAFSPAPSRPSMDSGERPPSPSRVLPKDDRRQANSMSRPSPSPQSQPEVASVTASPLTEEMRLLAEARAALRAGDPRAALALTDEHGRRFRAGVLAFERSKLKISALCASGRRTRARGEIEALRARAPAASAASDIDRLCPGP